MTTPEVPTRALSVIQPWGWAIVEGHKPLENRGWRPPVIGETIAIHASKGYDYEAVETFEAINPALMRTFTDAGYVKSPTLARGAFIGTVRVKAFFDWAGAKTLPRDIYAWYAGGYGWLLEQPRPLKRAVPAKGRLTLWKLDEAQRAGLRAQLEADWRGDED